MSDAPADRSISALRDAITSGDTTAERVTRDALDRIDANDGVLSAITQTFRERALDRARAIDQAHAHGDSLPPLAGVTLAIKENICTNFARTTCSSKFLEHYESPFSATAIERLEAAGAIIVCKTNMDEFGMGSSTEHSALARTRNPWDTTRVPGGSSGGSAAAVAASFTHAALGSDTGGSIRQPAALCGVVGLKPTYGRVSRWGLVAFASSLDVIGPFARSVEDAARVFHAIAGHDPHDGTSWPEPPIDPLVNLDAPVEGLTLGVPSEARSDSNHPDVARAFEEAVETYRALGARIIDIHLPRLRHGISAYYVVAPAEASSNLARFDGIRYGRRAEISKDEPLETLYARSRAEGFGPEVQRRIIIGTYALSSGYYDAYYTTALRVRRLIKQDFDDAFAQGCHAILMPTSARPAFELGAHANDPLAMYLEDVYTVPASMAGLPAISIPCGFSNTGAGGTPLPIGMQLVAPAMDEPTLLRIARAFEKATDFNKLAPI